MRPDANTYRISKDELSKLNIPYASNMVIVHVPHQNINTRTKSGVYVVGDHDFNVHHHLERWGYVYECASSFEYEDFRGIVSWDTDIECEVGDKVWFDFRAALHAYTFIVDDEWYKVLDYSQLYVAKRGEDIIPLNGYVLLSDYIPETTSSILISSKPDDRFAVVEYCGSKNKRYQIKYFSDDIDINPGDHIMFEQGTTAYWMEDELHMSFDKKVRLQQRKRILGTIDEEHENLITLRGGVIGVKPRDAKMNVGGIDLIRPQARQRIGDVVHSTHDKITEGSIVVVPKQKGTEFKGIEYYTEERIFYYETT